MYTENPNPRLVKHFHNNRRKEIQEIADKLTDIVNGPVFEVRDTAYFSDGNIVKDHFSVYLYEREEGDERKFWNLIGLVYV